MTRAGFEGCDLPGCDHGWVDVDADYIERAFPWPAADDPSYEPRVEAVQERRVTFAGAVHPCPRCRPRAYGRWQNGCFTPNHASKTCELCRDDLGTKAVARHDAAVERVRADLL